MMATVLVSAEESEAFGVEVGVKQGCAMAPVLFNIYLAAVESRRRFGKNPVFISHTGWMVASSTCGG